MRTSVASLSKKFISTFFAATLALGLVPAAAFAEPVQDESATAAAEGEAVIDGDGVNAMPREADEASDPLVISSGEAEGLGDEKSAPIEQNEAEGLTNSSGEDETVDNATSGDDITIPAASERINETMTLQTRTVAQAESTRSYFLAQTLESTRTVPIVSANLPLDTSSVDIVVDNSVASEEEGDEEGSDDDSDGDSEPVGASFSLRADDDESDTGFNGIAVSSTVIGSFTENGITYAVEPGGESVAAVAVDYGQLPDGLIEAQTIVIPGVATADGRDFYTVSRIADGAFSGLNAAIIPNDDNDESAAGITTLGIPASITAIGDEAFAGSDTLQYLVVEDDNPTYVSYDGALYSADENQLRLIPEGRVGTVWVAPSAATAAPEVFSHCPSVNTVVADPTSEVYPVLEEDLVNTQTELVSSGIYEGDATPITLEFATLTETVTNFGVSVRSSNGAIANAKPRLLINWGSGTDASPNYVVAFAWAGQGWSSSDRSYVPMNATITIPKKPGYKCIGFGWDSTAPEYMVFGSNSYSTFSLPDRYNELDGTSKYDLDWVAVWVPDTPYYIGLDSQGGTWTWPNGYMTDTMIVYALSNGDRIAYWGESTQLVTSSNFILPSRPGYRLRGFAASQDALDFEMFQVITNSSGVDQVNSTYVPLSKNPGSYTKVYAVWWPENVYKITLSNYGATDTSSTTYMYEWYGEGWSRSPIDASSTAYTGSSLPSKQGYRCLGYAESYDAKEATFLRNVIIDENTYNFSPDEQLATCTMFTKDTTLYPVWAADVRRTITFDYNGGESSSNTTPSVLELQGSAWFTQGCARLERVVLPSRAGFTCLGYATTSYAEKAEYFLPDNTYEGQPASTMFPSPSEFTSNTTLYAVWRAENVYGIFFDYNGGQANERLSTTQIFEMYGVGWFGDGRASGYQSGSIYTPYRWGYTFKGYALDADATSATYWTEWTPLGSTAITSAGGISYDMPFPDAFAEDTTLYAVWERNPIYKITLDHNGGGGYVKEIYLHYGASWQSDNSDSSDQVAKLLLPGRSGYHCVGYATSKYATQAEYWPRTGGTDSYPTSDIMPSNTEFTEDTTLYAVWRLDGVHMITLDANGGKGGSSTIYEWSGHGWYDTPTPTTDTYPYPYISLPKRFGYRFMGYATSENATTPQYWSEQNVNTMDGGYSSYHPSNTEFSKDTTLYAVWQKLEVHEVVFAPNGGSGGTSKAYYMYHIQTYWFDTPNPTENSACLTEVELPTKPGYTCIGFTREGGDPNHFFKPDDKYADRPVSTTFPADGWGGASTFTAVWEKSPIYKITLNKQGGTGSDSELFEWYGAGFYNYQGAMQIDNSGNPDPSTAYGKYPYLIIPTKPGYVFKGYATKSYAAKGEYWTDVEPFAWDTSKFVCEMGSPKAFTENTTLYAVWWPENMYEVTLDLNDGTGAIFDTVYELYGENWWTTPTSGGHGYLEPPAREGYRFKGFAMNATATEAEYFKPDFCLHDDYYVIGNWPSNTSFTEDITLYAVWEEITCHVNFSMSMPDNTQPITKVDESALAKQTWHYGDTFPQLPVASPSTFYRTGYTFDGWCNVNASDPNALIADSDGNLTEEFRTGLWDMNVTDLVLAPAWTAKEYTLSFNPNYPDDIEGVEGDQAPEPVTLSYDAILGVDFTLPAPTFGMCQFNGWFTTTDPAQSFEDALMDSTHARFAPQGDFALQSNAGGGTIQLQGDWTVVNNYTYTLYVVEPNTTELKVFFTEELPYGEGGDLNPMTVSPNRVNGYQFMGWVKVEEADLEQLAAAGGPSADAPVMSGFTGLDGTDLFFMAKWVALDLSTTLAGATEANPTWLKTGDKLIDYVTAAEGEGGDSENADVDSGNTAETDPNAPMSWTAACAALLPSTDPSDARKLAYDVNQRPFVLPDVVRAGYDFKGWKKVGDNDSTAQRGLVVNPARQAESTNTLNLEYAPVFAAADYTILLKGNMLGVDAEPITRKYTESFTFPYPTTLETGSCFSCWADRDNTNSSLVKKFYPETTQDVASLVSVLGLKAEDRTITLYAVWMPSYSVDVPLFANMAVDTETGNTLGAKHNLTPWNTDTTATYRIEALRYEPILTNGNAPFQGADDDVYLSVYAGLSLADDYDERDLFRAENVGANGVVSYTDASQRAMTVEPLLIKLGDSTSRLILRQAAAGETSLEAVTDQANTPRYGFMNFGKVNPLTVRYGLYTKDKETLKRFAYQENGTGWMLPEANAANTSTSDDPKNEHYGKEQFWSGGAAPIARLHYTVSLVK